jgi:hypothetical protein
MLHLHFIVLVVLPVFFIILITVTGRLEKRLVWQCGDLQAQPPYPDCSAYVMRWTAGALQSGFTFLGWAADPRTPGYRLNYSMLVSPGRDCFVMASSGNIFKLAYRSTTIYTQTTDGKVYFTTDHQNGAQIDLLGHWMNQLAPSGTFAELLRRHQDLLRQKGVIIQPFTAGRETEEFRRLREERYENMARRGLIDYLDGSRTSWHFTLWGALRYAILNYTIGIVRGITQGHVFKSV